MFSTYNKKINPAQAKGFDVPLSLLKSKPKESHFTGVISIQILVARTEGGSSNTFPAITINDAVLRSLIEIVNGLRRLGVHDENGVITYREGNV